MTARAARKISVLRHRIHMILESGLAGDRAGLAVHRGLIALVLLSVAAVVLETVPEFALRHGPLFSIAEAAAVAIFTLEYALRVWSAPDHTLYARSHPLAARLGYMRTGAAIVDLVSILPYYASFLAGGDLRILVVFRLFRFFKLARYSPGMGSLFKALQSERKALASSAIILMGLVLVAAAAMHVAEREIQPEKFGSIPEAMWWAVVTLTTVGYGDAVPLTLAGRMIAGVTMIAGLAMLALPVGIIATAFADEIHRREFIVNWAMIARVPLFATLDASEIAEIMPYLHARTLPAGAVVFRRGEVAQSMFFIAAGEVEVDLPTGPVRIGEGHFFGEMAVLRKTERSATIRTLQASKLLVLDASDLHGLIERNPDIGERIDAVVRSRQKPENPTA